MKNTDCNSFCVTNESDASLDIVQVPSLMTFNTGGRAVMSCGNKERTLSKSNRNRQSLSSERAGDVGVDRGVPATSVGGATGICNGGRTGTVRSEVTSNPKG